MTPTSPTRPDDAYEQAAELLAEYTVSRDMDDLTQYVYRCTREAIATRQPITERINRAVYAQALEYAPGMLPPDDPDAYSGIIAKKCRQAEGWLRSVLTGAVSALWTISPTARPEIPEELNGIIMQRLMQEAQNSGVSPEMLQQMRSALKELAEKHVADVASDNAAKMQSYIADILDESVFTSALTEMIKTMAAYPYAVIEGPVIVSEKAIAYDSEAATGVTVKMKSRVDVRNVDPLTVYWSSDSRTLQDGSYVIVDALVSTDELLDAAESGVPGFIPAAINAVCDTDRHFDHSVIPTDTHIRLRRSGENDQMPIAGTRRVLKFYGKVPGKLLKSIDDSLDARRFYETEVWSVDGKAVRAALCTNPLGKRAFYAVSMYATPYAVCGKGIADVLADTERACNSALRQIMINLPLASAPIAECVRERLVKHDDDGELSLEPRRVYDVEPDMLGTNTPVFRFHTIPVVLNEAMAVFDKFSAKADELSGIPAHLNGNLDIASMARTASGMSMLMKAATQTLQNAVSNIDQQIIVPLITALYNWVMLYHPDKTIKADARIRAQGVSGVLNKELGQAKLHELLSVVSPFAQAGIVPPSLLVSLLRQVVADAGYDPDELIPADTAARALEFQNALATSTGSGGAKSSPVSSTPPNLAGAASIPDGDGRFIR